MGHRPWDFERRVRLQKSLIRIVNADMLERRHCLEMLQAFITYLSR